jgi:hypothetical protein
MVRKSLFGDPEGYAVRASKTFRTVSLGSPVNKPRYAPMRIGTEACRNVAHKVLRVGEPVR